MPFLLMFSNQVIKKMPAGKNALNNIFENKKLLNTFQEVLGHKITELHEYKKYTWTIAFLILKLILFSVILGICGMPVCVQNVLNCIISGDKGADGICHVLD